MSNLKRKIGCESVFHSSDDDGLCAELDSVEVKYKKLKSEEDHFLCHICGRSLKHRQSLNTHLLSHTQTFYCPCGKQFKHKENFYRHQKRCVDKACTFNCNLCSAQFRRIGDLSSHMDNTHSQSGGRAPTAVEDISQDQPSTSKDQPSTSKHKPSTSQDQEHSKENLERRSALNESAQQITIYPQNDAEKYDLLHFYSVMKSKIQAILKDGKKKFRDNKFSLNTRVRMIRTREEGEELIVPHFISRTFISLNLSDEEHDLNTAFQQMLNALEEFIHRGSDWRVDVVIGSKYGPLHTSFCWEIYHSS